MTDVAKMYDLQKLDTAMEKARRRLIKIKQAMGESEEIKAARAQVAATEAELHHWHGQQLNAELESRTLQDRVEQAERDLMSGRVRNPKELQALQDSIASLQRHHATVEEHGVEAMLQVEELTMSLAEMQRGLADLEQTWTAGQSELAGEDTKYKRLYLHLKKQREAVVGVLDPKTLDLYEQVRARKAGIAIAAIENNQCGACHVLIPTGVVSAARTRPEEVTLCPSCGRILFAL